MKKPYVLTSLLLTFGLAASLVFAQKPEGPRDPAAHIQRHIQHLTTVLSLTPAQQQQATTIFTNAMSGGQSFHADMKTAHQNLEAAIKNNDPNGITQAANTIGNLTAQMIAAHAKAQAAFYQILTPDQQSKLSQLESEGHDRMFFGGPPHF
jgi:Spy/CpxP family protein refolding chaperone